PGSSQSTSGQQVNFLFESVTGKAGKPAVGAQLDALRSAAIADGNGASPATAKKPAKQEAAATAPAAVDAKRHAAKQPAKPAKAKPAKPRAAKPAKPRAAKPQPHAAPAKPYRIYDSVSPGAIPDGKPAAVYANGSYAASSAQVAGHHSVLWIDTNGSDPAANVLDVEPGDATPAGAAHWVKKRLSSRPHEVAIVYTMRSEWRQVRDHVAALPPWMQSKVRYWIADPTGVPHVVAGASATQWYWGHSYDVTTAKPNFMH
ncbi:MAG: hypothetical protein ACRDNW_17395, partial [Trebonia sp.]